MDSPKKNKFAVALGRKGGRKGGPARAANMTAEQRSESARKAVKARWERARKGEAEENQCYTSGGASSLAEGGVKSDG